MLVVVDDVLVDEVVVGTVVVGPVVDVGTATVVAVSPDAVAFAPLAHPVASMAARARPPSTPARRRRRWRLGCVMASIWCVRLLPVGVSEPLHTGTEQSDTATAENHRRPAVQDAEVLGTGW